MKLKLLEDNNISIICYHCSNEKFNKFSLQYFGKHDTGMWGRGIYLTNKIAVASQYGHILYTCKLNLQNPFIIESGDMDKLNYYLSLGEDNNEVTDKLIDMGYDGLVSKNENFLVGSRFIKADQYVAFNPNDVKIIKIEDTRDGLNIK